MLTPEGWPRHVAEDKKKRKKNGLEYNFNCPVFNLLSNEATLYIFTNTGGLKFVCT